MSYQISHIPNLQFSSHSLSAFRTAPMEVKESLRHVLLQLNTFGIDYLERSLTVCSELKFVNHVHIFRRVLDNGSYYFLVIQDNKIIAFLRKPEEKLSEEDWEDVREVLMQEDWD